jgi:hypothetical protein
LFPLCVLLSIRNETIVRLVIVQAPLPVLPPLGGGIGCAGILPAPMQARRLRTQESGIVQGP